MAKAPDRKKFDLDATRIKVIELLLRHQPHELSFSKVARFTGVPRSTLYYYFGSSFKGLIDDAVKFGISKFTQIETIDDFKNYKSWEEFQLSRLKRAVAVIREYPWAPLLYMRYRVDNGALGENIRHMEKAFLGGHSKVWEYFHKSPPRQENERIVAAIKVGFLWGIGNSLPPFTAKETLMHNEDEVITEITKLLKQLYR